MKMFLSNQARTVLVPISSSIGPGPNFVLIRSSSRFGPRPVLVPKFQYFSRPRPVLVPSESEKFVLVLARPRDELGRGRS